MVERDARAAGVRSPLRDAGALEAGLGGADRVGEDRVGEQLQDSP